MLFVFSAISVGAGTLPKDLDLEIIKPSGQIWVMVIDTGITYHPKLSNYVQFKNTNDYRDIDGHGTHVAGIVAYGNHMSTDAFGDALCPQVKIFSCNYFAGRKKDYLRDSNDCINKATRMRVDYINISSGGKSYDQEEYNALKSYVSTGGIVVAAAGNESSSLLEQPYYPASYAVPGNAMFKPLGGLIVVSNVDRNGELVPTSNYWIGARKAMGKDVLSTVHENTFMFKTGTSQAAPTVLHEILKERCKKFDY